MEWSCFFLSSSSSPPTVVECVWGVCWITRGFLLDFSEIKTPVMLLTAEGLLYCINQSQSPQTWRSLKCCLHAFLTVDLSEYKLCIMECCVTEVEPECLWGKISLFKTAVAYFVIRTHSVTRSTGFCCPCWGRQQEADGAAGRPQWPLRHLLS